MTIIKMSERKTELMTAFDRVNETFEAYDMARVRAESADRDARAAKSAYENAKLEWEKKVESCAPGDMKAARRVG